jgi:hypothetical protein
MVVKPGMVTIIVVAVIRIGTVDVGVCPMIDDGGS